MASFPFITSIFVAMGAAVLISVIVNKGFKSKQEQHDEVSKPSN